MRKAGRQLIPCLVASARARQEEAKRIFDLKANEIAEAETNHEKATKDVLETPRRFKGT